MYLPIYAITYNVVYQIVNEVNVCLSDYMIPPLYAVVIIYSCSNLSASLADHC